MREEKNKEDSNREMILHCQRNIQRALNGPEQDLEKVVYYLTKLRKVKVGLDELESTGIGRTVNSLKKSESREISEQSTLLVNKWKSAVKEQVAKEEKQKGSPDRNKQIDEQIAADLKKASKEFENRCKLNGYDLNPIRTSDNTESSNSYETSDNNENKEKSTSSSKRKIKVNVEYIGRHDKVDENKKRKLNNDEVESNKSEKSHHDRKERKKHDDHKDRHKSHKSKRDKNDKSHDQKHNDSHKSTDESNSHKRSDKHHKSSKSTNEEVEKKKKHEHRSKDKSKKDRKKEDKNSVNDLGIYSEASNTDTGEGADFGAVLLGISDHTSTPSKKKMATPVKSTKNVSKSSTSTTFASFKTPSELISLSNGSKLAPLDVDVSTIYSKNSNNSSYAPPTASTFKPSSTYTPATLSSSLLSNSRKSKNDTEEDALSLVLNTKHQRTKVFSGGRSKFRQEVPSLFTLCIRILREHFDALEYTGGVPYEILKSVLEQVTPDQLYNFETFNPYLIGETDELWHHHAMKDFKNTKRQEFESWRDVYLRGVEEQEEKFQMLTANLKQNNSEKPPPRRTILAYVDNYAKPPHGIARKKVKNGVPSGSSVKSRLMKGPQPSETAVHSVKERIAREQSMKERVSALTASSSKVSSIFPKKKVAPLMQKTLSMMKGVRFKR